MGRCWSLPEYRAVRGGGSILDAIADPALAAELTLQPVHRYGVDAAILYSDIVVPVNAIGFGVDVQPGVGPVPLPETRWRVTGLDECDAKPEMSVGALGGVLVGLWLRGDDDADAAETVPGQRVWIAGVLTGNRLESFADKAELTIALQVLEASDGEQ